MFLTLGSHVQPLCFCVDSFTLPNSREMPCWLMVLLLCNATNPSAGSRRMIATRPSSAHSLHMSILLQSIRLHDLYPEVSMWWCKMWQFHAIQSHFVSFASWRQQWMNSKCFQEDPLSSMLQDVWVKILFSSPSRHPSSSFSLPSTPTRPTSN